MFDAKTMIKLNDKENISLFSDIAEQAAIHILYEKDGKPTKSNKSTQIRKFYDELCLWENKVNNVGINNSNTNDWSREEKEKKRLENYDECIPFIYMMKAKIAYSQGRKSAGTTLINQHFSDVFNQCIDEIKTPQTLRKAKLFMEAVMGFYKLEEEKTKKGSKND